MTATPTPPPGHDPMAGARTVNVTTAHGQVWCAVVGEPDPARAPLLVLHGGPGASHDYLTPLADLARRGRQVVLYDQLGAGRSDHPGDGVDWSLQLFVDEVAAVRTALDLDRIHLLGQSWGGMLALEHVLAGSPGVVSLTLASTMASTADWEAGLRQLRAAMPAEVRHILEAHEATGTTDDPAYAAAVDEFYRAHVCRADPWPECLQRSMDSLGRDPTVYTTMWGPNEFAATGVLAGWSATDRLGGVTVPTLVTSGRYDESTASVNQVLVDGIAGARWEVFGHSAHMAHLEQTDEYLDVIESFMRHAEAG